MPVRDYRFLYAYNRWAKVTTLLRQLGAAAVATDFLVFVDEQGEAGDPGG